HVNPDGDAIGSMMALTNALRERGKHVDAAVDDGVPSYLSYIDGSDTIYPKLTSEKWDLMISVDSSDEERTGTVGAYGREHVTQVINLDHHVTNTFFGDAHLVKVDAVSATEVVYLWLKHMEVELTKSVATPLLTGLVTDTMGFRTSNVLPETFGIAQDLMHAGASITEVTARTLDSKPYHAIRLWSQVLQSVSLDGQVISVNITQSDLKTVGLKDISDSGLVGLLNQVNEAMIAVIFMELEDGKVKLSLRSKRGYDVGSVAMGLGGGGHTQASGATIDGSLDAARERVLPLLQAAAEDGELIIA
ncbi:MAG: bifunctional oligoribonuclease/PAP phosphatase NrnA, partial [Chloroflexota bacterium]